MLSDPLSNPSPSSTSDVPASKSLQPRAACSGTDAPSMQRAQQTRTPIIQTAMLEVMSRPS